MSLTALPDTPLRSRNGEPTVEVTAFFPAQGRWSESTYLDLTDDDGPRCEFVGGRLEPLPDATDIELSIADFLADQVKAVVGRWNVHPGGYRIRIRKAVPREPNDFRYPDVIATLDRDGRGEKFATAATLVAEVVSGEASDRERDLVDKRRDYAEAGVPEYWVVDPEAVEVIVYRLAGRGYEEAARYGAGQTAVSVAIDGFEVDIDELFATPPE